MFKPSRTAGTRNPGRALRAALFTSAILAAGILAPHASPGGDVTPEGTTLEAWIKLNPQPLPPRCLPPGCGHGGGGVRRPAVHRFT
jgi:hypothetical protein